jgi:MFS family permease
MAVDTRTFAAAHATEELTRRQLVRATVSSALGTTIEWYDFNLYSVTAGLYLGKLFFPTSDAVLSTLFGFGTLLVGYVVRPLGAMFFGHMGDRVGRKATLIGTLMLMGVATFLIGLVPTYAEIGIVAGIILILLRMLQGFGVGGEWGGSVLLTLEWGNKGRRGFLGSFPMAGAPAGLVLAYGSLNLFTSLLGANSYWGWRIPFLISSLLVAVGLYIRLGILETPVFAMLLEERKIEGTPSLGVLRFNFREVFLCLLMRAGEVGPAIVFQSFILFYATKVLHFKQSQVLTYVLIAAAVGVIAIPIYGYMSDLIGRKKMYLIGAATMALFAFPYWFAVDTALPEMVGLAIIASFLVQNMQTGPEASLMAESFTGRRRYSGTSLGYHFGAAVWGGTAPLVALGLFTQFKSSSPIALYMVGLAAISFVAVTLLRDRSRQDLSVEYDLPPPRYRVVPPPASPPRARTPVR